MASSECVFASIGALIVLACSQGVALSPATTAAAPLGFDRAVMAQENGVQVIAEAKAWPGSTPIEAEVTPLRLIIRNESGQAIQLRYSSFSLTTPRGISYRSIPPREVQGFALAQTLSEPPAFSHMGFRVAPYYGEYYSGMEPYQGPFHYDERYHESHYRYWRKTKQLPTLEMLEQALPEGMVEAGGSVDGYLYFERLEEDAGTEVVLHLSMRANDEDRAAVSLQLPFVVE